MTAETPVIGSNAAPPPIVFTDAAAHKVGELIKEEDNPDLMLRVFISGGGCSGIPVRFHVRRDVEDGDSQVENQGVKLVVDPMSVQYLMGAEIDYRKTCRVRSSSSAIPNAQPLAAAASRLRYK